MKAIVIARTGGPEVLEVRDVPAPEPRGDELLVRVRACGLNRADLMQCRGYYPAPPGAPADIPGLEFAGEVAGLGPGCTGPFREGDRVFGIVSGGGQAEYLVTPERMVVAIPGNLDWDGAAAVPEVFITAHDALDTRAGLRAGESVLIHAIGSGVGTAALQLATAAGALTIGTSRTPEKLVAATELGLNLGLDTGAEPNFADPVRAYTGDRGVDVVLDLLGAPALAGNLQALAVGGRLVEVGLLGGGTATIELATLLRKRLTIVGTTLRARPIEQKIAATQAFAARVVPLLARGSVRPIVDRVFAFDDVRAAQKRLEANLGFGKVVLRV